MKTIDELLSNHRFFADLPPDTLELIAGCAINVHFGVDELVIAEDDPADHFYVVRSGKVAIQIDTPRQGPQTIETVGPGQLLGVSWLVPPHRWTFGARAVESTSAISIDAACLREKCDADPELGYEMLRRFSTLVRDRLQHTRLRLLDLYGTNAS